MSSGTEKKLLLLAVDGGGTRCRARLADLAGKILGEAVTGPANISVGLEESLAAVAGATRHCLKQAGLNGQEGNIIACLALAGACESHSTDLSSEEIVKGIRRATRKRYSAEEKIRIVLDGLRGEHSIAELCRREGIAEGLYYSWSKEFLEAGKRRLAGDTARAATSDEVKDLRRQAQELKEVVAEQALELRLLKKSMIADGGDEA
jgi:transposase